MKKPQQGNRFDIALSMPIKIFSKALHPFVSHNIIWCLIFLKPVLSNISQTLWIENDFSRPIVHNPANHLKGLSIKVCKLNIFGTVNKTCPSSFKTLNDSVIASSEDLQCSIEPKP